MKATRERGWLGIAGLAAVAAALAWGAAREFRAREARRVTDRGSVFASDASGTRALFLLLKSEGLAVSPLTRPPSAALEKGLLVIVDPGTEMDAKGAARALEWIEEGGAVLVAGETFGPLGDALDAEVEPPTVRELGLALPAAGVTPRLAMATGSDASIKVLGMDRTLLERGKSRQAVEVAAGAGRAVLVADAFSATNAGIDAADNAAWWVETCRRLAAGRPVMFLETVHGFAREPSIPEYLSDRGLVPLALQAALVAAVALWVVGSRKAPPLAPSTLVRRPAAEYAATMAQLYRQGRSEAHAAAVALAELAAWWRRPSSARALARMDKSGREAAADTMAILEAEGRGLAGLARPGVDAVHGWVARAAAFRRSVSGDDRE